MRPMYGQLKKPMTKMSTEMWSGSPSRPKAPPWSVAEMAMAKSSSGNARKVSISRLTMVSTRPP